jgi:PKHD-type hydroxylase
MTDYDSINHNVYVDSDDGQYGWHKDAALGEMYDLKLTVIANISTTPYKGGNFEIFVNSPCHIAELDTPGSALIFPSFLNHRVKPVTQGTRETLSFWIPGPNFK